MYNSGFISIPEILYKSFCTEFFSTIGNQLLANHWPIIMAQKAQMVSDSGATVKFFASHV